MNKFQQHITNNDLSLIRKILLYNTNLNTVMPRKYLIPIFFLLLLITLAQTQRNICYSNCREGYCTDLSPRQCTSCDRGQVNINGRCISGSTQPYPLSFLTITDNNQLADSTNISTYFNCTVSGAGFFNQRPNNTLVYQTVPGTTFTRQFTITEKHQYVQFKFNAAVVQSTTSILEYELQDQDGKTLFSTREPNLAPADTTLAITCTGSGGDNVTVQNVFFIQQSVSTTSSKLTLQVKSLDNNAVFGVSNFQIYYGSCHPKCKTCSGPTQTQCLTCQGLYMRIINGTCQTCPLGFYDGGNECKICPGNCQSCQFSNLAQAVVCTSCLDYAERLGGSCVTKYEYYALPADLIYQSAFGWRSTELASQPLTLCGRYSLIGGVSIGRGGSKLQRTFTNLEVHSLVDIYLTFWMIDQQLDDKNVYQIYLDGLLIRQQQINIAAAQQDWALSNQCGNSNPELSFIVTLKKIPHQGRNLTLTLTSFKNWFGFRDFNLVINNKTGVIGCYEEQNGKCISCLNGFKYDPATNMCNKCSDGCFLSKNKAECQICPVECKTCEYDLGNSMVKCLTCYSPLEMVSGMCKDTSAAIYSREIIPSTLTAQTNNWILYPKLPQKGITTCGGETILGSEEIKYKFLTMKREFTNLPPHRGIKLYFHFYQIDTYTNESVYFMLNGNKYPFVPSVERKEICGDPLVLDSIVKIDLLEGSHVDSTLAFELIVNGKVKVGVNNVILFLMNCDGCNNQVGFKLQSIPVYSLSTPPVKGMQVKVIFSQPLYNSTAFSQAVWFSIRDPNVQAPQSDNTSTIVSRQLQGLIQFNKQLPFAWEQIVANREYRSFLQLDQDYNLNQIIVNPVGFWNLATKDGDRNKLLSSMPVSNSMARYIEIDENNIDNRKNMRNLRNLFQGCAIFALWIGLLSFIFGFSPAFDDFFTLVQVLFAHIFIQLAYSPASFRIPLQGMQIVQFMAWLPWQARVQIEKGIIANDLYQHSPIEYQQYYQDIVFARTIYHTILFLIFMVILFLLLKVFSHIMTSTQQSKRKHADSYLVKYYNDYQHYRFAYLDKFMRFAYFTVVWACTLQFIEFKNSPKPFNIWNSVICIVMFVIFVLYPIAGFGFLWRTGRAMSDNTFKKNFEDVRIAPDRLFHFIWRYYRLLLIALLIGLIVHGNPLAILIPLIVMHIVDGAIIIVSKPFGMEQETQLNVCFYNHYPKAYWITSALQSFLFALLELFILITYAVRDKASNNAYLGLGYFCCAIVVVLLLNGLVRLVWGFIKIVEGCFSKSKEMKLQVENKAVKEKEQNEELVPIKSIKQLNSNMNTLQTRSRLNTLRKQSYVSKIS